MKLAASIETFNIIVFIRYCDRDFQGQANKRCSIVKQTYTHEEMMHLTLIITDEEIPLLATNAYSLEPIPKKNSHKKINYTLHQQRNFLMILLMHLFKHVEQHLHN